MKYRISLLVFLFFLFIPGKVFAQMCSPSVSPSTTVNSGDSVTISYDLSSEQDPTSLQACPQDSNEKCYEIKICDVEGGDQGDCGVASPNRLSATYDSATKRLVATFNPLESKHFWLEKYNGNGSFTRTCGTAETTLTVNNSVAVAQCDAGAFRVVGVRNGSEIDDYNHLDTLRIKFDGSKTANFNSGGVFTLGIKTRSGSLVTGNVTNLGSGSDRRLYLNGSISGDVSGVGPLTAGQYSLVLGDFGGAHSFEYCRYNFNVTEDGDNEIPDDERDDAVEFNLCRQAGDNIELCDQCLDSGGVWTAVGCIPFEDPSSPDNPTAGITAMLRSFITIGLGIAGGVVVLMVLAGSFLLSTSQGDPKRVEEGKSLISSAVIGLLFVIFSITILRFIGVNILQIPGFGN